MLQQCDLPVDKLETVVTCNEKLQVNFFLCNFDMCCIICQSGCMTLKNTRQEFLSIPKEDCCDQ